MVSIMERRSSRNGPEHTGIKDLDNLAEKKTVSKDGNELRVNLDGLQLNDQTHRKLKVHIGSIDNRFELLCLLFFFVFVLAESTYSAYWNWRSVATLCLIYEPIP